MRILGLALLSFIAVTLAGCVKGNTPSTPGSGISFSGYNVVNYDASTTTLNVKGSVTNSQVTDLTTIYFYAQSTCTGTMLGSGLASAFANSGIALQVSSATPTTIYMALSSMPGCFHLLEYTPEHGAPPAPGFLSTLPASPSRVSYTPQVLGTVSSATKTVKLYDDAACSHLVGSGTAADFVANGISVTLTADHLSSIYGQAIEAFGNTSPCTLLTTYLHSTNGPAAPTFSAIAPVSPNGTSTTPVIKGTVAAGIASVTLYSDSACATAIATDTAAGFTGTGTTITVAANASTNIYATATDASGLASTCGFLTTYVHDNVAPGIPTFTSATPASPTRLTIYPVFTGTLPADAARVNFYTTSACSTQIGSGTKTEYEGTGITVSISPNAITSVYATSVDAAGNRSLCTKLADYLHNNIPPPPPVFSATNPVSPNNISYTPLVQGNVDANVASVVLFKDSDCTQGIGNGSAAAFMSTGVQVTVPINTVTDIYAQAIDIEGNISACAELALYAYSNLAAPAPGYVQTTPASPSRFSQSPYILGTAASSISKVAIYTDAACTTKVGSGSRSNFVTIGVQATVPPNSVSSLYGMATDVYGNDSPCTYLTSYTYTTVVPTAPMFSSTNPVSPNNQSGMPSVRGSAPNSMVSVLPTTKVTLYDSLLCLNQIGTGTPADLAGAGITAMVPANVVTSIYGQTSDAAGNLSACTFLSNYTYATNPPGKPVFTSTTPASPSYTRDVTMLGTLGTNRDIVSTVALNIYTDSACTNLLLATTPAPFLAGTQAITMPRNTTSTLYGTTVDSVGNVSACNYLTDFVHNDLGPTGLITSSNPDGSINLTWTPDLTASPMPQYIVKRSVTSGGPYTVIQPGSYANSINDLTVSNGVTYYYVVQATNNTGTSLDSAEASFTVSAPAPTATISLAASAGSNGATLTWSGFSTDAFYRVYRATQPGGPYTLIKTALTATAYIDSTITNGTTYYYVVSGVNPSGESAESAEVSVEPLPVPGSPTGLTATFAYSVPACGYSSGIQLSWSAPSYYNTFTVLRGSGSGTEFIYAQGITGTSFVDCNPQFNANYYIVRAVWGNIASASSNEVVIMNVSSPTLSVNGGDGEARLSWTDNNAATYDVLRSSTSRGPYTTIATGVAGLSYQDTAVTNGNAYYYVIRSVWSNGAYSWNSNEAGVTPQASPGSPANLTLVPKNGLPTLYWSPPKTYNYFNIYRATNLAGPYSLLQSNVSTAFYIDATPLNGMNYYRVTAVWGAYETPPTSVVSFRNGAPATLTATPGTTAITLNWSGVGGAVGYNLWRANASKGPYSQIATPTASNYTDGAVVDDTGYYYVVTARFADGTESQYSPEVGTMLTTSDTPAGLSATNITASSVTLTWAKVQNATLYNLYKATNIAGPYTSAGSITGTTSTQVGLLFSTQYFFKVSAIVSSIESPHSPALAVTTYATPAAPLASGGNNQVSVQWATVTSALSYTVLVSSDGINFSTLASGISGTTYTDTSAVNGQLYFYKVAASFPGGTVTTSLASAGVTPGQLPYRPEGLTVVANAGSSVDLTWAPVPGATSYNVYQSTTSGGPWGTSVLLTGSPVSNTIAGLTAGTKYYFVVTSLNGGVESAVSDEVAVVAYATPSAPLASVDGSGNVALTWTATPGASTYDVYRATDLVRYSVIASGVATASYTDSSVSAGPAYTYKYLPRDASGTQFALSSASNAVTSGVAPQTPVGLFALPSATPDVLLNWTPVPNAVTYNVYRGSAGGGPYTFLTSIAALSATYTDAAVSAGSSYFYVVSAVNASGVESGQSNEAGVKIASAPASLTASSSANNIHLSWSAVGGASSYTVKRALKSGGPYGAVATAVAGTSFDDGGFSNGLTYYYVVSANFPSSVTGLNSNEASALGQRTMNLQVPIELIDRGLASNTSATVFERSRTSLTPSAYDGTVTYAFEITASNSDVTGQTVALVDASDTVRSTITVPPGTSAPTRLQAAFAPGAGATTYRVRLSGTPAGGELQVFSARMLVNQVGATKTRLYIPLLASSAGPTAADSGGSVETSASTSYNLLTSASPYIRDTAGVATIATYNAWRLETLVASSGGAYGYVALANVTRNAMIDYTQGIISGNSISLVDSPFNEGQFNFSTLNEGDDIEVSIACSTGCAMGTVNLYKAALWLDLTDLSGAKVYLRNSLGAASVASATTLEDERSLLDLSKFSNPGVYFAATLTNPSTGSSTVSLRSMGATDSGTSGSTVSGSTLTFSGSLKAYSETAAPISPTSGQRFLPEVTPLVDTPTLNSSYIVIRSSR